MNDINQTLKERGERYGVFADNAAISQALKDIIRISRNWKKLTCDQKEALDLICAKIGRILTGDPDYADNWCDIAGYATLVEKELTNASSASKEE